MIKMIKQSMSALLAVNDQKITCTTIRKTKNFVSFKKRCVLSLSLLSSIFADFEKKTILYCYYVCYNTKELLLSVSVILKHFLKLRYLNAIIKNISLNQKQPFEKKSFVFWKLRLWESLDFWLLTVLFDFREYVVFDFST